MRISDALRNRLEEKQGHTLQDQDFVENYGNTTSTQGKLSIGGQTIKPLPE